MHRYVLSVVALVLAPWIAARAEPVPLVKSIDRARALSSLIDRTRRASSAVPMDEYLRRTAAEKDPRLYKLALGTLLSQKIPLTATQRRQAVNLIRDPGRGLLPRRLPLPRKGPIEVRYFVGSDFFDEEVQALANQGFNVTDGADGLEARRGRLHVVVRQGSDQVLRDLKDRRVHAVIYSGHSNLGGVVERGLQQPNLGEEHGAKLVVMLSCKGIQTLPLLAARLPKAHLLTTINYSYAAADQAVTRTVLDGLEGRWSYAEMRRQVRKIPGGGNYLFPDRTALLQHSDYDRNGVLDSDQLR